MYCVRKMDLSSTIVECLISFSCYNTTLCITIDRLSEIHSFKFEQYAQIMLIEMKKCWMLHRKVIKACHGGFGRWLILSIMFLVDSACVLLSRRQLNRNLFSHQQSSFLRCAQPSVDIAQRAVQRLLCRLHELCRLIRHLLSVPSRPLQISLNLLSDENEEKGYVEASFLFQVMQLMQTLQFLSENSIFPLFSNQMCAQIQTRYAE